MTDLSPIHNFIIKQTKINNELTAKVSNRSLQNNCFLQYYFNYEGFQTCEICFMIGFRYTFVEEKILTGDDKKAMLEIHKQYHCYYCGIPIITDQEPYLTIHKDDSINVCWMYVLFRVLSHNSGIVNFIKNKINDNGTNSIYH